MTAGDHEGPGDGRRWCVASPLCHHSFTLFVTIPPLSWDGIFCTVHGIQLYLLHHPHLHQCPQPHCRAHLKHAVDGDASPCKTAGLDDAAEQDSDAGRGRARRAHLRAQVHPELAGEPRHEPADQRQAGPPVPHAQPHAARRHPEHVRALRRAAGSWGSKAPPHAARRHPEHGRAVRRAAGCRVSHAQPHAACRHLRMCAR